MNGYMNFVAYLQEKGELPESKTEAVEKADPIWQSLSPAAKAEWKANSKTSVKASLSPQKLSWSKLQRNSQKTKHKLEKFDRLKESGFYDSQPEEPAKTPSESCDQNQEDHQLAVEEATEREPLQSNIDMREQNTPDLEQMSVSEIRRPAIDETMKTPTMENLLSGGPNRNGRSFSFSAVGRGRGFLMKSEATSPGIGISPGQNSGESSVSLSSPPNDVMKLKSKHLNQLVQKPRSLPRVATGMMQVPPISCRGLRGVITSLDVIGPPPPCPYKLVQKPQSLPPVATGMMHVPPISCRGLRGVITSLDVIGPPPPCPYKLCFVRTEEKQVEKTEAEILNEFCWNGEGHLETCIGNYLSFHKFKESEANEWDSLDEYSKIMRPRRAKATFIGKVYAELESQEIYNKQFIGKVDSTAAMKKPFQSLSHMRPPSQPSVTLSQEKFVSDAKMIPKRTTLNSAAPTHTELCVSLDDQDDFIEPKKRGFGRGKPL